MSLANITLTASQIHFHGQSQPCVEECLMKNTTVLCERVQERYNKSSIQTHDFQG